MTQETTPKRRRRVRAKRITWVASLGSIAAVLVPHVVEFIKALRKP